MNTQRNGKARAARGLRALVIQHERSAPPGYVHRWLEERGAAEDVYRVDVGKRAVDPRDYGIVVSLGSESAAYDDSVPWIETERQLLLEATAAGVPVLGICFGAQLLAQVLGGDAHRAESAEIGWRGVRSRDQELIAHGPWFQWHFDTFAPPPAATLIADSAAGPQAFTAGPSLGVQFHPEVTPEIIAIWANGYRHELDEAGVDPDRLLTEAHDRSERSYLGALRLFDAFLDRARRVAGTVGG